MKLPRFQMRIPIAVVAVGLVALVFSGWALRPDGYLDRVFRSIDLLGKVYKEVSLNYVNQLNPEKFMRGGINGMLNALDPYTVFIGPEEASDVDLMTSGKYGGIGITIGVRDGSITVISLMEGYSAQRQGIREGDRILEIDSKTLKGMKINEVRSLVRGEPGTEIHMKIQRAGELRPIEFVLQRQEIQLRSVTYAGFIDDGIAYIRIERFLRTAGDDLRKAITELSTKRKIRGVIVDLRDNPGGLLEVAVDITEKFVPKGSIVVSTRGRAPESEKRYTSNQDPMLGDVPMVVLVNHNSASASEIVAGAIQDLDRGVILGTQTFGKGLVQTIMPLDYNASLKITTARYYTPSGRCIQELDYSNRNDDGAVEPVPDSLRKEFLTLAGRPVFSSGGIMPDTTVKEDQQSELHAALLQKAMFFKFATEIRSRMTALPPSFRVSDSLLSAFQRFLANEKFSYETASEVKLKELRETAEKEKLDPAVFQEVRRLSESIDHAKDGELRSRAAEMREGLLLAISDQFGGDSLRIAASLPFDRDISVARSLLESNAAYKTLLTGRKK